MGHSSHSEGGPEAAAADDDEEDEEGAAAAEEAAGAVSLLAFGATPRSATATQCCLCPPLAFQCSFWHLVLQ